MKHHSLPAGLIPKGSSSTFTQDTLPDAFCKEHSLRAKRWGALHILEGSVTFIDFASSSERELTAPEVVIVAPEELHRLQLHDGPLRCRVDFFEEPEAGVEPRMNEVGADDPVRNSFQRCEAAGNFPKTFYDNFLASSAEIAPLFANTDFSKQHKLLRASAYMLVTRDVSEPKSREAIERIGQSHSRHALNIAPKFYEYWLTSLCETIRQMDPYWTVEVDKAWRERVTPGMQLITAAY